MYRSRLKVKTLILLCMTGVLMILALRRDPDRKGETGEELLISEEKAAKRQGKLLDRKKYGHLRGGMQRSVFFCWIRVEVFIIRKKMQGKDIRENLITMKSRRGGSLSMKYRWRNIFGLWFPARCRLPIHWKR